MVLMVVWMTVPKVEITIAVVGQYLTVLIMTDVL